MTETIVATPFARRRQPAWRALLAFAISALVLPAGAQQKDPHQGSAAPSSPPAFVASTAKPFAALMEQAMAVMDQEMQRAPMTGVVDIDFITMMIPHHQGAIDMAKAVLVYTSDPALKNLAQGIITEQQTEIRVMQAWLQRYQAQHPTAASPVK